MTPLDQAGKSRNARLNQAAKHAGELMQVINLLSRRPKSTHVDEKDAWQDGRNSLEKLTQCFHEANAYNNVVAKD